MANKPYKAGDRVTVVAGREQDATVKGKGATVVQVSGAGVEIKFDGTPDKKQTYQEADLQ